MYRYGISLDEYNKMLSNQNFGCAICGESGKKTQHLSVDHDHASGTNRGLLCDRCNRSLGGFKDSEIILIKAIEYLKSFARMEDAQ